MAVYSGVTANRTNTQAKRYELPESTWKSIVLPKVEDVSSFKGYQLIVKFLLLIQPHIQPAAVLEAKKQELAKLQEKLSQVQEKIAKARAAHPARVDELKVRDI